MHGRSIMIMILILLTAMCAAGNSHAVEVRATVDRDRIAADESIRFKVTIGEESGSVDVSPINDFNVMSRGTSTSIRIVNGQTSREVVVNYLLVPLKTGKLQIPALPVTVKGNIYQTRPIAVTVSPQTPTQAEGKDLFVAAAVSETAPFIGQQVIYTLQLFTAVRVNQAAVRQAPTFDGFAAEQVQGSEPYRKILNGREYIVRELIYVLIPLQEGLTTIGPAMLTCEVVVRGTSRRRSLLDDFFDDPFWGRSRTETRHLRSNGVDIQVRPLPDFTGPQAFSGLVGQFALDAALESHQLTTGDSTTLTVTIAGRGNIKDATMPVVDIPDAFKMYTDNPEENVTLDGSGYHGQKVYRIALVGLKPGAYTLPPLQLTYFDVHEKRYQTLSSTALQMAIRPGDPSDTLMVASAPGGSELPRLERQKVEFTGRDILPLKETLDALEPYRPMGPIGFSLLLIAPMILFLGVLGYRHASRQNNDPTVLMAQRCDQALKKAEACREADETFLAALQRAVTAAVHMIAGKTGEALTHEEVVQILVKAGKTQADIDMVLALLNRIDATRYGGQSPDREQLLRDTREVLRACPISSRSAANACQRSKFPRIFVK